MAPPTSHCKCPTDITTSCLSSALLTQYNDSCPPKMDFDDVLKSIGEFGRFQKVKYFLLCLVGITVGFQALGSVFTLYNPKHRCALPKSVFNGTDTWMPQSPRHQELVDIYVPRDSENDYEQCKLNRYSDFNGTQMNSTVKCDRWVYDTSEVSTYVVMEWNLVCDKKLHATVSASMFMIGNLVGSLASGVLSDWLGRRKTLLIAIAGQFLSGLIMAFAPELYSFSILRFICGFFTLMMFLAAYVIGIEIIGPKYRLIAGCVIQLFWGIGFALLVGIGYAIREWMYIQLAISLPILLFFSYYWLIPESARWLLVRGKNAEAEKILLKIAKTNGTTLPPGVLEQIEEPRKQESPKAIFRAPRLLARSLIIFYNWFVISMTYYGLSLNSGNMPGGLYLNLTLSAVAEILGYIICFLVYATGRKKMHVIAMVLGGLGCICSIPVLYIENITESGKNTAFVALNFIGKVGVTIGFSVIYIWCAEIFPTLLRTSLMGGSSVCARIGSIFAPVIADIGKIVPPAYKLILPPLIFGIFTISGGLLSIILPETSGKDLPETVEEANVFPKKLNKKEDENGEMKEMKT